MHSGSYVALAWDVTDQLVYNNTHVENIYDAEHDTIYPTTRSGRIWDMKNRKQLVSTDFRVLP